MPKGERIYKKIRTSDLCNLFSCTPDTLRRWIREDRLDISSLKGIIEAYLDRSKLDRRRKKKGE